MSASMLMERPRQFSKLLCRLILTRPMGGGPRTFPGGVSKWKWKRMHEKRAKEKEKRLLDQEKQLYEARLRSQIRAKVAGKPDPFSSTGTGHNPMNPNQHLKALADRFMKEGAEDLWNEKDGPIVEPPPSVRPDGTTRSIAAPPLDLRKLISKGRDLAGNKDSVNLSNLGGNYVGSRNYSAQSGGRFRRNDSSSDDSDFDSDSESVQPFSNEKSKFGRNVMRFGSSASLGKYDMKIIKRRVPLNSLDDENDFEQQVEVIRSELNKKKAVEIEREESEKEESILSEKRFDECGISPLTVKALTSAGYIKMTRVQEAAVSVCLEGKDALVKAKTGTGKTAAFLLPAIEAVVKAMASNTNQRVSPVFVLILCPTRELASQIAAETNVLLRYHDGIGMQTLVGGTRFKEDQKRLESNPCQIIVATPGRLLDHIENKSGLSVRLMGLKMLILDEAGHLLDLGFRRDIEKIVDCLPRRRQSLLFTATLPKEVRRVSQLVLQKDHIFVDTVGLGFVETHAKVKQSCFVAPHELHFQIVHQLLMEHISESPDYKVIVFCTTGMVTSLLYHVLREMKMNVKEIHSRKPQLYRTRVSEEFRVSKRLILVTSDVSARGMNYPDVTLVIQVGIPSDREQYIHRLGRAGREGKEGRGILLLAPWEEYFLDELKDLPVEKFPSLQLDRDTKLKIDDSMTKIDTSIKEAAFHAWLGYYNSIRETGRDKTTLVEQANKFCESIGLQKPPSLFRKTALKMGLKDIPGIRIRK
ncbi:probable DEAD-box ATP-dependent RNA helicase 48 [Pyrus x bretschneideri]|uniref:probable DEAD-box ATP-dependent RNA helicase 48 n=1 Tax=Pyrus x bretschneideri TaxID=225117 RepID=UPI002030F58D|nr:probable DEAD-box ATP-dependent RNA helicase 48 [Pyrus x bretschneideri]